MRRTARGLVGVAAIAVIGVIVAVIARCDGTDARDEDVPSPPRAVGALPPRAVRATGTGAIAGTVRDAAGTAIAGAIACADAIGWSVTSAIEPSCAQADGHGRYRIAGLGAARYQVSAGAPGLCPASYDADPALHRRPVALAPGEARAGVDLVLRRGCVEVTGTVGDVAGGPIAHARVRAEDGAQIQGPPVETDATGRFALWTERGTIALAADADGYARAETSGLAPGRFELRLTPEATLAGVVIDAATQQPVAGARVHVALTAPAARSWIDVSDGDGRFRVERLAPGRMQITATTDHGYGTAAATLRVGLGDHIDGARVTLYPAYRVVGRAVVAGQPSDDCTVVLDEPATDRHHTSHLEAEGQVIDGVIPGRYGVTLRCAAHHARRDYPAIEIRDRDALGLTWPVDAGATIHGQITQRSGAPVPGATITARGDAGTASGHSEPDGSYAIRGLAPGSYHLRLDSGRGVDPAPDAAIELGADDARHDVVLDDGGAIAGTVADAHGQPVAGVEIAIHPIDDQATHDRRGVWTDAAGAFRVDALVPGRYTVIAQRGDADVLRAPGSTEATPQGARADVHDGETAQVALVVDAPDGRITGTVRDAAGAPVADAFVTAARDHGGAELSRVHATRRTWGNDDRPIVTGRDGTFRLDQLPPGTYTVRVYRSGGGEVIAEQVAVGADLALQLQATAAITGTVRTAGGAAPSALRVTARDRTGLVRTERPYRSAGRFELRDLPAGAFTLVVEGDGAATTTALELAAGEVRAVALVLEPALEVTGRVVEYGSARPVPGVSMTVDQRVATGRSASAITDGDGRFTLRGAATGKVTLRGYPADPSGDLAMFSAVRDVPAGAASPVDVGTIGVLRRRVRPGEPYGMLGLRVTADPHGRAVAWIHPSGPAAHAGLVVGDVITQCDGVDLASDDRDRWLTLTRAPPGTKLALTTQRGSTYTIVLAPPPGDLEPIE